MCSDGLTDLVEAEAIRQTVSASPAGPGKVARALVDAANDAGGKDNVTVVYVEGEAFRRRSGDRAAVRAAPALHGWVIVRCCRDALIGLVLGRRAKLAAVPMAPAATVTFADVVGARSCGRASPSWRPSTARGRARTSWWSLASIGSRSH